MLSQVNHANKYIILSLIFKLNDANGNKWDKNIYNTI